MSDRNTALLLPGHVPPKEILSTLLRAPGVSAADFDGEEAPRVGHGRHNGTPYTVVALRVFELGGLLLMDRQELPGPDDLEGYLGMALSAAYGRVVFVQYNDEAGVGGHALFEGGLLRSREVVDGRWDRPVARTQTAERVLEQVDPSDWVWPLIAERVEAGLTPLLGPGLRTDDDIERLITQANPNPAFPTPAQLGGQAAEPAPRAEAPRAEAPRAEAPRAEAPRAEAPRAEAPRARKRDRVLGLLKGLLGGGR